MFGVCRCAHCCVFGSVACEAGPFDSLLSTRACSSPLFCVLGRGLSMLGLPFTLFYFSILGRGLGMLICLLTLFRLITLINLSFSRHISITSTVLTSYFFGRSFDLMGALARLLAFTLSFLFTRLLFLSSPGTLACPLRSFERRIFPVRPDFLDAYLTRHVGMSTLAPQITIISCPSCSGYELDYPR